ncbi:MAG TPA: molybdenum cofactor biosynthesis protein B [Abditibacteriaceae bacterium]|jgi:molybdenum cofactor biosynthesis protein B
MAQHPDHQAANQKLDNVLPVNPDRQIGDGHRSDSTEEHRSEAPASIRCFILTVSDTRTEADDRGGALIKDMLNAAGHTVNGYRIVRDEVDSIARAVDEASHSMGDPECIVVTGGSGIGQRDVSPEALRPLLSKEMPGFGEVFRMLSWEEVGPATMLSRAFAGVMGRTLLFVLPGSTNAVRLAMEKLIVPELGHLVREIRPERRTSGR